MKVRPRVRASLAADPAGEALLDIGQLDIGPPIAADQDRVAAAVVGAKDKQPTHAHVAHLGEGDFLGAISSGHVSINQDRTGLTTISNWSAASVLITLSTFGIMVPAKDT